MGSSVEEVREHVKSYLVVFMTLGCLTALTVAVSYIDLSMGPAIGVALFIASI